MSLNIFFLVSGPNPSSYRPSTIDTPAEPPSLSSNLVRSSWSRASILPFIDAVGGAFGGPDGFAVVVLEGVVGGVVDAVVGGVM